MNSVDHVPQTLASHIRLPEKSQAQGVERGSMMHHGADMLKPDPRDTFYSSKSASHYFRLTPFSALILVFFWPVIFCVWLINCLFFYFHWSILNTHLSLPSLSLSLAPMIDSWRLENVLPACLYSPTYVVKDFPIARYQGLQFVSHIFMTFILGYKSICQLGSLSVFLTQLLCHFVLGNMCFKWKYVLKWSLWSHRRATANGSIPSTYWKVSTESV